MGAPDTPGWGAEAAVLDEVLRLADASPNPSCASLMAGGVPGAVQGKERRGKLAVEEARARASREKGGDARGTPTSRGGSMGAALAVVTAAAALLAACTAASSAISA